MYKFNHEIQIGQRKVGPTHPPFIIAEISGNHQGSIKVALELIDRVSETGVDAIKFQTYTADTLTLNSKQKDFLIADSKSLWKNRYLHELYQEAHTPWEWHQELFDRCQKNGVMAFSSAFDDSSVDFLESLKPPCYKVASFENIHHPLLRKVANTKKPMIVSTGLASLQELAESVQVLVEENVKDLILLKCTSSYPASPRNSNLKTIPHMSENFKCLVGLSDHTLGIGAAVAAVTMGACAIEKHVTMSRTDGGVDSAFSLEPSEVKMLVEETRRAWESVGDVQYGPTEGEVKSLQFRRSIYFCKSLKQGDVIQKNDIRIVRPGHGLQPKYFDMIVGKTLNADIEEGTAVQWDLFK